MRLPSRTLKRLGIASIFLVAAFFAVRTWVVPAIIVQQIEARYHGKVEVGNWWFGWKSAGLTGVRLHETPAGDSPTWFAAERVSTDLSISALLHGRIMPGRIEIDRPSVDFRLDAKGQPLTRIPIGSEKGKPEAEPLKLPEIVTKGGEITLAQDGRKPMTIRGVDARLSPVSAGSNLDVKTDDPDWGGVAITGHFNPSFKDGEFQIATGPGFVADPAKLERIPFIPSEVWANIEPRGPVDAKVKITLAADSPRPVTVHTDLTLKGATAKINSLQVESRDTTGRVVIDDAKVKVEDLKGKTLDGTIGVNGTLDFGQKVPRIALDVRLKGVDVTKAPASWQLQEEQATGRLSGRVDLKVALDPSGPDLTGTTGRAVIEDGSFQGIPVKSMGLGLKADGNDLQYATLPEGSVDKDHLESPTSPAALAGVGSGTGPGQGPAPVVLPDSVLTVLPYLDIASRGQGWLGWSAFLAKQVLTFEVRHAARREKNGFRLPRTIATKIELEDVELETIVAKAKKFGIVLPFPVAGRLSIKATATIPLGSLRDIKGYAFRGDATLRGASIDHVDLGLVSAHLELADGMLDLSDFRGQLVDKPSGSEKNPPKPTPNVPSAGPLPPGAFRGNVRASISPPGPASARFEGDHLPLGEIFAPVLPYPSPLSGEVTLRVEAAADLGKLSDPGTWKLHGQLDSRRIKYFDATLDQVTSKVAVKEGRVEVTEFAARLLGKPLKATGHVEIAAPYRYGGGVTVEGWEVAEILKFVPGMPSPPPASGVLNAKGDATGALQPFDIATKGAAQILGARAGPAPIGNLGFHWKTDQDAVEVTGLELLAFGGRTSGAARIPIRPGKPLHAWAELKGIDSSRLAAVFLGKKGLKLAGKADGRLEVTMPLDASVIDGKARLEAPDLIVREGAGEGVPVKSLLVQAVAREGSLDYEATAEGLGGKVRFHGSAPIAGDLAKAVAEGEFLAVGFRLGEVAKAFGMANGPYHLDGQGAIDANIRTPLSPFQLAGRGQFEVRDLRYGNRTSLGNLKGIASLGPTSWRVDQLQGDLLGGVASGEANGRVIPGGPNESEFDFRVDRISLAKITNLFPSLAHDVEGFGSLRVAGRVAGAIRANAEILVPRARAFGLPITDLRMPVDLEMIPATGDGSIHSRHWTARVAGGSVRGNASNRFGIDRSFQAELQLAGVDLEVLSKFHPTGKRPPTGKVSGRMVLQGPNAEHLDKIRGRVDLDLDDASLIELPLFKELDRFLGSSGGGLFDDGDVHGTIANRTLYLEQLTLTGKLVQMHATGSITFNGGLNLEILINTNANLSAQDLALLNLIPGLGSALGQGEEALRRVAGVLENSLLRFRVSGNTSNPHVQLDPGVAIGGAAVGFFTSVIKIPGR
jgi:translocation and assembly module TamB